MIVQKDLSISLKEESILFFLMSFSEEKKAIIPSKTTYQEKCKKLQAYM